MSRCTVTCHDARSHVTTHCHMSRCTVTCHDALSHVTMHGHMSRRTVTCHDALSHVTTHCHMSRCTVTCHDALSHVTMHGHKNVKFVAHLLRLTSHYLSHNCRIQLMHLSHPVTSSNSPSPYKSGCCIRRRSRTVISTCSLLWNMPRWARCVSVIGNCVGGDELLHWKLELLLI